MTPTIHARAADTLGGDRIGSTPAERETVIKLRI